MSQPSPSPVPPNLPDLARSLRESPSLTPEAQRALADLVAELGQALEHPELTPGDRAHLLDSVQQVAQALRVPPHHGLLSTARDRLEAAAVRAETTSPLVTGVVRRFLDALANLGI
jgi:hypothetical protein